MTYCDIRDINDHDPALRPNLAPGEPTHIHIPRPSRRLALAIEAPLDAVQLESRVQEAA